MPRPEQTYAVYKWNIGAHPRMINPALEDMTGLWFFFCIVDLWREGKYEIHCLWPTSPGRVVYLLKKDLHHK